jgi:class 3 adenylate cyclase
MADTAHEQRRLAAIMFTDMVGYSALAQRNEARAIEILEEHRRVIRSVLPNHEGREVKTTGDGFLIEFPSALAAVQGAVEIQKAMHERNEAAPPEKRVNIRIGIHLGDVISSQGDIHGDGVNIAARLEPLAPPGGICISSAVWEQVRNKVDVPLALLGPAELKNIELPVVVHRVVMPWESACHPAPLRPRRRAGVAALCAIGLLALVLAAARWWQKQGQDAKPRATDAQAVQTAGPVLFQTGFEAPVCRPGPLSGQDGWLARGGFSSGAAMVVASGSNQFVSISGSELEQMNTNLWSAWLYRRIPTNAAGLGARRISVTADLEFEPGSARTEPGYTAAFLLLTDARITPLAAVGFSKIGNPIGQNFAHPPESVHGRRSRNAIHHLRADYDFGGQVATLLADGELLGSLPFNPQASNELGTVSLMLQARQPINSVLRVYNLVVRSEAKGGEGK